MSHLEKLDTVVHDKVKTAVIHTLVTPFVRILDAKKRLGSLVLLLVGALVLASCGGSTTTTTTAENAATPYPNATLLVSGAALDVSAGNQVIIDVRTAALYSAGHITNAINIPHSTLNPVANTFDYSTAVATLSAAGVSNSAKIIVYGAEVDGNAGWVFWILEYLGATDVHMLDGGYAKWVADSRTVTTTPTTLAATTFTPNVVPSRFATKNDVAAHYLDTANYAIVDSRNSTDYLTARIPNAVSILIGDFVNADKTVKAFADIKTLLDSKGVTSGKTVITHCYVGWRSAQEYFMLRLMGFNVSNYDGSWTEWAAAAMPVHNSGLLVSGAALDVNAANQVIIDTRSAADYAAGHITNAINLPPSALDTTATSYALDNAIAVAALSAAGVANTANIILYDADVYANAGRVFWALEYLGATKVSVLDGGYAKWIADGRTVVTTPTSLPPATFTATVVPAKLATTADVVANYANTTYAIIDSRNYADYLTAHIPNAVSILTTDFLNTDKTVKSYMNIKTLLDSKGVTWGKTVIAHCYVGYRSGQEYFMLRLMGFNVSNYDGSMTEWSADPTPLPVNTGPLP